jgi:hypothetical protein
MKQLSLFTLPFLLLTGCFSTYRQSVEMDLLPAPPAAAEKMPSAKIGVIHNSSGAGLPVIIRLEDGLVETDKYSRWLMGPDQMLERELHRTLNIAASSAVRISGNVLTCEFDQGKQQAVLEVSFEVCKGSCTRRIKKQFTVPVELKKNSSQRKQAASMAKAMSSCFRQAASAAAELINEINNQK